MSLEKELLDSMAKDMAREIDKDLLDDLMTDVLINDGWTPTKINHAFGEMAIVQEFDWYSKTAEWIHLNAQGDYKLLKGQWLFKDPKDATMFILRWS
jgi:hypothetical protein